MRPKFDPAIHSDDAPLAEAFMKGMRLRVEIARIKTRIKNHIKITKAIATQIKVETIPMPTPDTKAGKRSSHSILYLHEMHSGRSGDFLLKFKVKAVLS